MSSILFEGLSRSNATSLETPNSLSPHSSPEKERISLGSFQSLEQRQDPFYNVLASFCMLLRYSSVTLPLAFCCTLRK